MDVEERTPRLLPDRATGTEPTSIWTAESPGRDAPIVLCGTVRDELGEPLRKDAFYVAVIDGSDQILRASTSEGGYSLAGLTSGHARIVADGSGSKRAYTEVELEPGTGLRRVDLVLERTPRVAVTLRAEDGRPLRSTVQSDERLRFLQLSVIGTRELPPPRLAATGKSFDEGDGSASYHSGRRGADGIAADLPEGADGWLLLRSEPPLEVSVTAHQVVLATQRLEKDVEALTFVVPLERLRSVLSGAVLRVVDAASGAPCTGASVSLLSESGGGYLARADAHGVVRQVDRPPGVWDLWISAPGYATRVKAHVFEPGETADLGEIAMQPPAAIRGRALGPDGGPVEGWVAVVPLDETGGTRRLSSVTYSRGMLRSDGTFELTSLASGRYALSFGNEAAFDPRLTGAPLAAGPVVVDSRAGPVEHLVVRLAPAALVRLRTDPRVGRRIDYEVLTSERLPVGRSGRVDFGEEVIALPPGDYLVVERSDFRETRVSPLSVAADPVRLELGR